MNKNSQFKIPLVVVSIIFFMWGFLTCLNDILIPHLKGVFNLNYTQSALIQFTFFGAYFLVSLPAGRIVSRLGYKNSIALGLMIAAIGTAAFYPSAAIQSYPSFLGALFVLASGITILQVAANPYVSLLGSSETAASRLNLAQALNALGTTVAPYFGSLLILSAVTLSPDQLATMTSEQQSAYNIQQATSVQTPYLILTAALLLLAIFIYFFKLPQVRSEQVSTQKPSTFGALLKHKHLIYGVVGIFVYVGAEVSVGSFLINFLSLPHIGGLSEQQAAHLVPYYWGGAMVGRFFGSVLMRKMDAGKLLGIFASAAVVLLAVTLSSSGSLAMWSALLVGLCNSIMFPTIFSLSIQGLGAQTEKASSLLIMAIVGGAIIPMIHGLLADHIGLQLAFGLPLVCYLYIAFFGFKGSRISSS